VVFMGFFPLSKLVVKCGSTVATDSELGIVDGRVTSFLSIIRELVLPDAGDEHRVLSDVSFRCVEYRCDQRPKPNAAQRMGAIGSDVEF
jgi:hypothetical protein